jgi:PAS domain S-box-containing protein
MNQGRLESLLGASPIAMFTCKAGGDFAATFVTEGVRTLWGYEPQDFLNQPRFWADRIHPDDASVVYHHMAQALARGTHSYDYRFRTKSGEYRWTHDELRLVRDVAGAIGDMTERLESAAKLAASEKRLRDILNSLYGFVGLFSLDCRLIECNRPPLEAAGLKLEELLGVVFWETPGWSQYPAEQAKVRDMMLRAAQGEVVRFETTLESQGRGQMVVDMTFGPLRDQHGMVSNIIAHSVNITARKQAQAELLHAKEAAESANRAKRVSGPHEP